MRAIRRGETGPAVSEIRSILVDLELLAASPSDVFDDDTEFAVRAFQQSRGIGVDGIVGAETWQALDGARWKLGARTLFHSVPAALVGEDVRALQERMLEMGYDSGRADGIYGARTARAVAQFQREVGLTPDGSCGPQTMKALRRLGRKVVGGRPQWLREAEAFRQSGPNLVGKTIVIDPGHGGGDDFGVVVPDGPLRWTEADLVYDVAARLEGRLAAAGMRVHLTRGPSPARPMPGAERAALANSLGADLLISLHLDENTNPGAEGVATYHYGTGNGLTSTVGERLANLVQREIVVRTGMQSCRIHAKTWELLRLTRMPAVRLELGYVTSPEDAARLADPGFRDTVAEGVLVAVQRLYLPAELDPPTGVLRLPDLSLL